MSTYPHLQALVDGVAAGWWPTLRVDAKAALAEIERLRGDETKAHQRLIRQVADREILIDLLRALRLTTNIAEIGGHCVGYWTPEHQALAREYAAKARNVIAKAELNMAEGQETAETKGA